MDSPAGYFTWGFISISLPNLVLMGLMILAFAAALVLPFPFGDRDDASPGERK